ncbi:hypothetical protein EYF80_060259 [Liparis tanakae]|uniref:Uncharacterized protein n=1 Tax=Liparis tanakae TaxID=230148 RepID=A0A4Z2EL70_9TELE|nr:hypothetical protein EYF80_060259 [Liparis tanakae]
METEESKHRAAAGLCLNCLFKTHGFKSRFAIELTAQMIPTIMRPEHTNQCPQCTSSLKAEPCQALHGRCVYVLEPPRPWNHRSNQPDYYQLPLLQNDEPGGGRVTGKRGGAPLSGDQLPDSAPSWRLETFLLMV